ncbi:MAG: hypothetical protein JOZ18_20540, partial [Chloroflexi bacterium]|nr:hypothetical protein [Chloroflexota bacterium]
RMGLYPGGEDQPLNFDLIDGNDILKQTQGGKQSPRNNLIGRLIIHAVYDGLLVACCQGDSAKLSNYCWTAKMPQDGPSPRPSLTVPELGIDKYYRGTWRILAPTT